MGVINGVIEHIPTRIGIYSALVVRMSQLHSDEIRSFQARVTTPAVLRFKQDNVLHSLGPSDLENCSRKLLPVGHQSCLFRSCYYENLIRLAPVVVRESYFMILVSLFHFFEPNYNTK